jgi:hypothetical protein
MSSTRDEQIHALIGRLSNDISLAHELSLTQTALLLEMAKLDLRMVVHSISEEELRVFTRAVEGAEALAPFSDSCAVASLDLFRSKART